MLVQTLLAAGLSTNLLPTYYNLTVRKMKSLQQFYQEAKGFQMIDGDSPFMDMPAKYTKASNLLQLQDRLKASITWSFGGSKREGNRWSTALVREMQAEPSNIVSITFLSDEEFSDFVIETPVGHTFDRGNLEIINNWR